MKHQPHAPHFAPFSGLVRTGGQAGVEHLSERTAVLYCPHEYRERVDALELDVECTAIGAGLDQIVEAAQERGAVGVGVAQSSLV